MIMQNHLNHCLLALLSFNSLLLYSTEQISPDSNILLNKLAYSDKELVYFDPYYETEHYAIVRNYDAAAHLVTDGNMLTYWESYKSGESLTIDLQVNSYVDNLNIFWGKKHAVSYDLYGAESNLSDMHKIGTFTNSENVSTLSLKTNLRYIKILPVKTSVSDNTCSILEVEATGECSFKAQTYSIPAPENSKGLYLSGGNWKLQRKANVSDDGFEISTVGYKTSTWIPAVVPGTVLTSYIDAKAVPDIRYSDNQKQLSESFFQSDFWYRNEFYVPEEYKSFPKLVFTGINYRIKVFLNGKFIGESEDVFRRTEFDIKDYIRPGADNALAVLVQTVDNPGMRSVQTLFSCGRNAGLHSTDSPAFFSSIGWDWIPSIPDRNIGLWNHVYISKSGAVSVKDPYVVSKLNLPDTTVARLSVETTLINNALNEQKAQLQISFDDRKITKDIILKPSENKKVVLSHDDYQSLILDNPRLWWPNGYGNQELYDMKVTAMVGNQISDEQTFKFGIRELYTRLDNDVLTTYVNGHKIFIRGGNIGGTDITRRLEPEHYDRMMRLHKEMNFTAVRNWVGQTAHKEFYDACDKYGILIWDDFWMSSGGIELVPLNFHKFMTSARDKILQVRNHPSLMVYCGRNESYPPKYLNDSISKSIKELDPYRYYAPSSAHTGLTGFGPYTNQNPQWYFKERGMVGPCLHSEIGGTCVPSLETIKRMIPEDKLWPINDIWGIHDFTMKGAQNASNYLSLMEKRFGKSADIERFCINAQMLNYEVHKAMYECYVANPNSNGLMMWMSQSAWPSFVWQTFDYFYDQTAAFFACKRASEPVHILWDSYRNVVSVSNRTIKEIKNLKAVIDLYDIEGKLIKTKSSLFSLNSNDVQKISMPEQNLNDGKFYFIKLSLFEGKKVLSDNFYWWQSENDYKCLNCLKEVSFKTKVKYKDGKIYVTVVNKSEIVVPMIRIKMIDDKTDMLFPAIHSDNYFELLPDEEKTIIINPIENNFNVGEVSLIVEGWNVKKEKLKI